jgi:hypothetical protein
MYFQAETIFFSIQAETIYENANLVDYILNASGRYLPFMKLACVHVKLKLQACKRRT